MKIIKTNKTITLFCTIIILAFTLNAWAAEEVSPPESNRMKPAHLPTPFTAAQLRDFNKGRTIKLLVEAPGKPNHYRVFAFREGDAERSDFDVYVLDADGKLAGEKQKANNKWTELQAHASYPKITTTLSREKKTTRLGTFDCWLYTNTRINSGKKMVNRTWFARNLPGPPVLMILKSEGKIVFTMTMADSGK